MENYAMLSEIVSAMKEKAENAYLNGEIATARHLAVTALESWPDKAPIRQISWCFAILFHCFKNNTDYYWLTGRYFIDNSFPPHVERRFSTNNADESQFIDFMMELIRPSISPQMIQKWEDQFLQTAELNLNNDVSTALLIETVIEMLCFFGSDKWGDIGTHFSSVLTESSSYVSREISNCVRRLNLQMQIIHGNDVENVESDFLQPLEQLLAHAWGAYFRSEFTLLDELIPQLSARIHCGSEFFLSVQGLATATELQRSISRGREHLNEGRIEEQENINVDHLSITQTEKQEKNNDKEKPEPWEYAKYYRYQRFETERPLAAFTAIRESNAKEVAERIRIKNLSKEPIASECWELFRIIPFLTSTALKYWDLLSLLEAYALHMEFHWASACHFENSSYRGQAKCAVDAIINAIMSVRSDPYKRSDVEQLINILDKYGTKDEVQRLYCFIFTEAPPITWNLCVEWLRLLGDLLPEDQLEACLKWTERYHHYSKKLLTTLNTEEYYYLHPILQHYSLSEEANKLLMFHFEQMFRMPPYKDGDFKTVLWYLADNAWSTCQTLMEKMLNWEENSHNQAIIINSCSGLINHAPKTKQFCTELLKRRGEKTGVETYSRFAAVIRAPETAEEPNLQRVYEALQTAVENISSSVYNSAIFRSIYPLIESRDWHAIKSQQLLPMLTVALPILTGDKPSHPQYRIDILYVLRCIFQLAAPDAQNLFADILIKHIETFKMAFCTAIVKNDVGDTIHFNIYRPEHLYDQLLLTFCQIYNNMSLHQIADVLSYTEEGLYLFPSHNYYPTYLFLKASENIGLSDKSKAGLAQLKTIAAYSKDDDGLLGILRGIESVYDVDGLSPEFDKILDFVLHIMAMGCDSLLYSNRIRTAKISNALSQRYPEQVQDTIGCLLTSKRKSIQNIFDDKLPLSAH